MNIYMLGLVKTKILANEPQPRRLLVKTLTAVVGISADGPPGTIFSVRWQVTEKGAGRNLRVEEAAEASVLETPARGPTTPVGSHGNLPRTVRKPWVVAEIRHHSIPVGFVPRYRDTSTTTGPCAPAIREDTHEDQCDERDGRRPGKDIALLHRGTRLHCQARDPARRALLDHRRVARGSRGNSTVFGA